MNYEAWDRRHREMSSWPDYAAVTPDVYVGGRPIYDTEVTDLIAEGITHVIDCRLEARSDDLWFGTGVEYLHIGVDDDFEPKPVEWFARGIEFALAAIGAEGKVYIHCNMGWNRGPSMAYAVLRALGMGKAEAYEAIRFERPQAGVVYRQSADQAVVRLGYASGTLTPV